MIRFGIVLITAGMLLPTSAANAALPRPADIDACYKQAVAAVEQSPDIATGGEDSSADSLNARQPTGSHGPEQSVSPTDQPEQPTESSQPSASPRDRGQGREANEAYRSAFAACLAQHGYYKGYYNGYHK